MLGFISGSIGRSIANLPFASSAGGVSFSFIDGALVSTSSSYGGIFGDRSQTLGRGRILAGASFNSLNMSTLRGVPMRDLKFRFAHQNVGAAPMGDPFFENDIIEVATSLKVNLFVTSVFLSYGVMDNLDVGVQLPLVRSSLDGTSDAQIIKYGETTPHLFGTTSQPSEYAEASSSGSSIGIGDLAFRVKANLYQKTNAGVALAADIRLPTGNEDNFHGSGPTSIRMMAIASAKTGDFSPHVNAGLTLRSSANYGNSVNGALGFDHVLSEGVTLAVDLLADFALSESELRLPGSVIFETPARRKVNLTDIPVMRDHLVDASIGFKIQLPTEYRVVTNLLMPMSDGGMRPRYLWTLGFERSY
jgi:hypothetical protein